MTQQSKLVSDIIKVLQGGIEFYEDALTKVHSPKVKVIFTRMIDEKNLAISQLQPLVIAEEGEPETGTSWAVDIRQMYTNTLNIFTSDDDETYVEQLEEVEDKVLEVVNKALEETQSANLVQALSGIKIKMMACHDQMKALQETI
jgi:uncharacterized protein (TIGR02284 family)